MRMYNCLILLMIPAAALAEDNVLTEKEKADGWQLLFNGKDYTGWKCNTGSEIASKIEEGCLQPHGSGGYLIVHEKQFENFTLKCDVKMFGDSEKTTRPICNSGIFFRISNLGDPVQRGLELQISNWSFNSYNAYGAIYDLAKARKNKVRKDPWGWHSIELTCKGPNIQVIVDGDVVTTMNCDEFTEPNRRPDGKKHKLNIAIKDLPRKGYIGFQDHGHRVWFKNVKIKELAG